MRADEEEGMGEGDKKGSDSTRGQSQEESRTDSRQGAAGSK